MSVFEVKGGPINRRYLDRKSKPDLITMYMTLLDAHCRAQDLAAERERELVEVLKQIDADLENRNYLESSSLRCTVRKALATYAACQEKESEG